MMRRVIILAVLASVWALPAMATPSAEAVKETAELVLKKLGAQAGHETVETISVRLERLAAKHGDDAVLAARKVGMPGVELIEKAGTDGPVISKLLAKYGDDGYFLAKRPRSVMLFKRYGDDVAEVLLKHRTTESIETAVEKLGQEGIDAFKKLDGQRARQLAMMVNADELSRIGRTPELLAVIGKYGDKGMDFVWRHKKALAVGAILTAFLAHPQEFIEGTVELAEDVTDKVVAPLAQAPGEAAKEVAKEAGKRTNWTLVLGLCIGLTAVWLTLRTWLLLRNNRRRGQQ